MEPGVGEMNIVRNRHCGVFTSTFTVLFAAKRGLLGHTMPC